MATAKKLPSGSWRTQVSKIINDKTVRKSFTVHPNQTKGDSRKAKALSEMQAREWQISTENEETYGTTIKQAMENYIADRSKVLSPSTITNYRRFLPYFEPLWDISINDIKTSQIQQIINEWSISVKRKTILNRISFLLSVLDYAECDKKFKLRYPQTPSKEIKSPDLEDVQMLINNADDDFKPILYLAAFGGMRRGEIVALKQEDISRDMCTIFVHADIVREDDKWVYKPFPKNAQNGTIQLPKFVIDSLPLTDGYVFAPNPTIISHKFARLRDKLGLPYNFHSLRHFAASFRSDLGIPTKYIEEVGRWKNSNVLKKVYDNTLNSSRKKYTQMSNKYLEENFKPKKRAY